MAKIQTYTDINKSIKEFEVDPDPVFEPMPQRTEGFSANPVIANRLKSKLYKKDSRFYKENK